MESELKKLEQTLAELKPQQLSPEMLTRLDQGMRHWHKTVPVEEKLVRFPNAQTARPNSKGRSTRDSQGKKIGLWRSVAAVAFLGSMSALLITGKQNLSGHSNAVTTIGQESKPLLNETQLKLAPLDAPSVKLEGFSPVSINRELLTAADDGVVLNAQNQAHRCIRLEYQDLHAYENLRGQQVEIEQPSVDYYIVPIATD